MLRAVQILLLDEACNVVIYLHFNFRKVDLTSYVTQLFLKGLNLSGHFTLTLARSIEIFLVKLRLNQVLFAHHDLDFLLEKGCSTHIS